MDDNASIFKLGELRGIFLVIPVGSHINLDVHFDYIGDTVLCKLKKIYKYKFSLFVKLGKQLGAA